MNITKKVSRSLSKVVDDPEKGKYAEYVLLVLEGMPKGEALKEVFPERYQKALDDTTGNGRIRGANITKQIRYIERSSICKELYEQAHKTWWISFLEKKNKLYENLYNMAMDEDINARERISSSKVMLEHMPSFKEDINIKVEVKQTKEDFVLQLKEMQNSLAKQAVEVIDVKVN